MMKLQYVFSLVVVWVVTCAQSSAQIFIVPSRLPTGWADDEGLFLTPFGEEECGWRPVLFDPDIPPWQLTVVQPESNWFNPEPYARWISPSRDSAVTPQPIAPGRYTSWASAYLSKPSPNTRLAITGWWGSNKPAVVAMNGIVIGVSDTGNSFSEPQPFRYVVSDKDARSWGNKDWFQVAPATTIFNEGSEHSPIGFVFYGKAEVTTDLTPSYVPRQNSRLPAHSGARNLVLVTHGWNGEIEWVDEMADAIRSYIDTNNSNPSDWEVVAYDWMDLASGGFMLPNQALANASSLGTIEGSVISARRYEKIHLIGHSAGASLITFAARVAKRLNPSVQVHTTYLDAYAPKIESTLHGTSSDWSEHYFANDPTPNTQTSFRRSHNVDVTMLDPGVFEPGDLSSHSWPHDFYLQTILGTIPSAENYGFPLSFEAGGWNPDAYPIGTTVTLDPPWKNSNPVPTPSIRYGESLVFLPGDTITGTNGFIELDGNRISFLTGSPVWSVTNVEILEAQDMLSLDVLFNGQSSSEGALTIFLDDEFLGIVDQRFTEASGETIVLPLGEFLPGTHQLALRLDPYTDVPASAIVSNVRFGSMEVALIPEPSMFVLFLIGAAILLAKRQYM